MKRLKQQRLSTEALRSQREQEGSEADPLSSTSHAVARMVVIGLALDAAESHQAFEDDHSEAPGERVEQEEAVRLLGEAIGRLPGEQSDLIHAAYFRGETLTSIAKRFGKHKSWATRQHDRALDRLASDLRQCGVSE